MTSGKQGVTNYFKVRGPGHPRKGRFFFFGDYISEEAAFSAACAVLAEKEGTLSVWASPSLVIGIPVIGLP